MCSLSVIHCDGSSGQFGSTGVESQCCQCGVVGGNSCNCFLEGGDRLRVACTTPDSKTGAAVSPNPYQVNSIKHLDFSILQERGLQTNNVPHILTAVLDLLPLKT